MHGLPPLAACLAMTHVAVPRLTPNAGGRPSVTSYAYGLYMIGIFCYWVLLHYSKSFKIVTGGFNGAV